MSYFDFLIRTRFLRNIYSYEELNKSPSIKNLEPYYANFQKFLKIMIFIENNINNSETYETIYHYELNDFLEEYCPAYSDEVSLLVEEIEMTEIKNSKTKIPKFTLKIYVFVYDILLDFPACTFIFETIKTEGFFDNFYRLINFKVHIHHSHVKGKIIGYAQNFCNMKVRENQIRSSCTTHNYLSFGFCFMLRGYRASC